MSEEEKMKLGLWYDANYDENLLNQRLYAMDLVFEYNSIKPSDINKKNEIIFKLTKSHPKNLTVLSPFSCDYGYNIKFGDDVYVNINSYFMDCATITIGNHCFIGPSCSFYTANHPLDYKTRNKGLEQALPITVGNNCWFGGNVTILPGVTIGNGCVIGAGSVVTKDIPDNSVVAGVPATIIKTVKQ